MKYGTNTFRKLRLTSIGQTVNHMLSDTSLQFLLIAALVATLLEMT
jgi:H+/gluconate symporter-like permease